MYGQVISNCQWSSFILGGKKNSVVYEFVFGCMCRYFEHHDIAIDYFMQNLLFKLAFEKIACCKNILSQVEASNPHLYDLKANFSTPYNESIFEEYNRDTSFFKLTYKYKYKEFNDGKPTFYRYIMNFSKE